MFTIRKATQADFLPAALILEGAKVKMFTEGIVQWDSGYTTPAYMQKDLDNGYLYVAEKDGEIAALSIWMKRTGKIRKGSLAASAEWQ